MLIASTNHPASKRFIHKIIRTALHMVDHTVEYELARLHVDRTYVASCALFPSIMEGRGAFARR